jgi:hypothetical protein
MSAEVPTYSLFPAPNYDVYTLRVHNEELCMELCWCADNNVPFVRLPGFQKAVPVDSINKENTFRVSNSIAAKVLTEPFDLTDPKFVSISYAELVTLLQNRNELISESTTDVMNGLYENDSLRETLKLPAVGKRPAFEQYIADHDALQARLTKLYLEKDLADKPKDPQVGDKRAREESP